MAQAGRPPSLFLAAPFDRSRHMSPSEFVNAALKAGSVEQVTDDGSVTLRLPTGAFEVVQIPLEHVMRIRAAAARMRTARSEP